jgi:hypothetical protein
MPMQPMIAAFWKLSQTRLNLPPLQPRKRPLAVQTSIGHQLNNLARAKAAAAARPPTRAVCQALRSGFFTVNRPLT